MKTEEIISLINNKTYEKSIRKNQPTLLDVAQFDALQRPCVYVMFEGDEPIYIGSATHGLQRAFNTDHHARKVYKVKPTRILMLWCNVTDTARKVEDALIRKLQPRWNRGGVGRRNRKSAVVASSVSLVATPVDLSALLRIDDAARLLSISVWMLRQLAYKKEIVSVKVGKLLMFRHEDLQHFVERNRVL